MWGDLAGPWGNASEDPVEIAGEAGRAFRRLAPSPAFLRGAQLLSILQTGRVFSGPELAEQLSVSERTIRTYIVELRKHGFNVETTRGTYGRYHLKRGDTMPPITFTDGEMEVLVKGLASISDPEDPDFKASGELYQRLARLSPADLLKRLDAISHKRSLETIKALYALKEQQKSK